MHEETVAQEEITLRDYLDLLRRRKWVVLQTLVFALAVGIIVALISPKVYRSEGQLLINSEQNSPLGSHGSGGGGSDDPLSQLINNSAVRNIETQMEVLQSPPLLKDTYKACNLPLDDSRLKMMITNDKDVDIINVAIEASSPQLAQNFTNKLMDNFIARDRDERNRDLDNAIQYAKDESQKVYQRWREAAEKVQQFTKRTQIVNYEQQLKVKTEALELLRSNEDKARSDLEGTRAQIAKTRANLAIMPKTVSGTELDTNPELAKIDAQLRDLRAEREGKVALYKPDHPLIKALDKQIAALVAAQKKAPAKVPTEKTITNPEIADTEVALRKAVATEKQMAAVYESLEKRREGAENDIKRMGALQFATAELVQRRDMEQNNYQTLQGKLADLQLRRQAQGSPITILSPGERNPKPVKPKRTIIILLAAIAGLFLGVCFALLQEFLDDRVNTVDDARRLLGGIPTLGVIPRMGESEQRLLSAHNNGGSVLESYRVLRSNMRFAAAGEPLRSIMVTSTTPGEGKSTTAVNLAVAMAMDGSLDGRRVVLVDADLRRPTVHEKFGIRRSPGLTNVLVGTMPLEKALQNTEVENLQILTTGPTPPNPVELLNSRAMEQLQQELAEYADFVIYDCPPCLNLADAQVLAATVDGVVYVVHLNSTKKGLLRRGHDALAHARLLGAVYNKYEQVNSSDYYGYGYYNYYHKYHKAELGEKGEGGSEWDELTAQAKMQPKGALASAEKQTGTTAKGKKTNGRHAETPQEGEES